MPLELQAGEAAAAGYILVHLGATGAAVLPLPGQARKDQDWRSLRVAEHTVPDRMTAAAVADLARLQDVEGPGMPDGCHSPTEDGTDLVVVWEFLGIAARQQEEAEVVHRQYPLAEEGVAPSLPWVAVEEVGIAAVVAVVVEAVGEVRKVTALPMTDRPAM